MENKAKKLKEEELNAVSGGIQLDSNTIAGQQNVTDHQIKIVGASELDNMQIVSASADDNAQAGVTDRQPNGCGGKRAFPAIRGEKR